MNLNRNNKGFTLVEMIVSIAILSIVMLEIMSLLRNTSMLYLKGTYEIDLQTESQQFINQLQELMVDCDNSISFNCTRSISDDSTITISNNTCKYIIQLNRDSSVDTIGGNVTLIKEGDGAFSSPVPMAEYVESLSLNMCDYESKASKVTIDVVMRNEEYSYTSSTDLYLRNGIGVSVNDASADVDSAYDFELDVLRYQEYDLDALFGEAGHSYTYKWKNSGTYEYDGIDGIGGHIIKCDSTLNNNWNYGTSGDILSAGPYIINRIDNADNSVNTIAVSTKKVMVGASGEPGKSEGFAMLYCNDGTSAQLDGYCPVFGVCLDKVNKVTYAYYASADSDFCIGNGCYNNIGTSSNPIHSAGDMVLINKQEQTYKDLDNFGSCSKIGNEVEAITHVTNTGSGRYSYEGSFKFKCENVCSWIDTSANCCVATCTNQFLWADEYIRFLDKGGAAYVKTTFEFDSSHKIDVYHYIFPVDNGGSSTPKYDTSKIFNSIAIKFPNINS